MINIIQLQMKLYLDILVCIAGTFVPREDEVTADIMKRNFVIKLSVGIYSEKSVAVANSA